MDTELLDQKNNQEETLSSATDFANEEALFLKQKIEKRKAKERKRKLHFSSLAIVIVFLIIFLGYSQYRLSILAKDEANSSSGTSVTNAKTGEEVVKALSRHILLPEGKPQIAEIQDVSKLQSTQAFFKNAHNGDIVVVYDSTIIIYRPEKDIIIGMGDMTGAGQVKP
jgi:hypothetical protein